MNRKEALSPTPERRAILLEGTLEDVHRLLEIFTERNTAWQVHFESNSYLMDPDTADVVLKELPTEDISETYRQLSQRTSGYQVLKIARPLEVAPGKKIRGEERIIKNYSTGDYLIVDMMGNHQPLPPNAVLGVLISGGKEIAPMVGKDPVIFDTLEEAKKAFLDIV